MTGNFTTSFSKKKSLKNKKGPSNTEIWQLVFLPTPRYLKWPTLNQCSALGLRSKKNTSVLLKMAIFQIERVFRKFWKEVIYPPRVIWDGPA